MQDLQGLIKKCLKYSYTLYFLGSGWQNLGTQLKFDDSKTQN